MADTVVNSNFNIILSHTKDKDKIQKASREHKQIITKEEK